MDKRFANPFGLTEEQAIALLNTPLDELEDKSDRYIAASYLRNCPSEASIQALIAAVKNDRPELDNRIVRRKAVESLGRLQATVALPIIRDCLAEDDCYTVENAVWAIGQIGSEDEEILAEIAQLLEKPGQSYRVIIHTLAKLDYAPAQESIQKFTTSSQLPVASAAIAAVCQLSGDYTGIQSVVEFLQHTNVNARRAAIQDLIDARHYPAIAPISRAPVSVSLRLRGIRLLAELGIPSGKVTFSEVEPYLDRVIQDHPDTLELVHEYDETPSIEFTIQELYQTDFGRCYLAIKTLLEVYPDSAGPALMATFSEKAYADYGAHYNVVKLLGWLRYEPSYDLLLEALNNQEPQFQKSRGGAAIALGNLGDSRAIPHLMACLNSPVWQLNYACVMALQQLKEPVLEAIDLDSADFLIRAKFQKLSSAGLTHSL